MGIRRSDFTGKLHKSINMVSAIIENKVKNQLIKLSRKPANGNL